jgi:hypothetical protein
MTVMPPIPTSLILENLVNRAPSEQVTLGWLLNHLSTRSFGIVLLLLGVLGLIPLVSPAAGLLLPIPAFQMMRAKPSPVFPRKVIQRAVPTAKLTGVVMRITPTLRYLERFVRPRWHTPFETTKRVIGVVVLLLGLGLFAPIPLSNIPIGLTIILLAFAYLEEDGALLTVSLCISALLFAVGAVALWESAGAIFSLT